LANAREQLSYTALIADAPGVITARQAEVGQVVQATVPIFSLARDGERDAVFNVYESLLTEPPTDKSVVVSLLENPTIKTTGTVREVTPAVSAQTGTVQVKVSLNGLPEGMQLGSVVSATAKTPGKSAVELPWSALTKNLSDPAVWLVDDEGKAQLHTVRHHSTNCRAGGSMERKSSCRVMTAPSVSATEPASNGRRPVNISNSTTPKAQMSLRLSTSPPCACSGLM
jgi:RND family efflux transporter MFP subunit